MKLPNTLLLTYKAEYENTSITIDELIHKYSVTIDELGDCDKWLKNSAPSQNVQLVTTNTDTKKSKETILDEINDFKIAAVTYANDFMKNDIAYADIKDFKDIVAIVDSIEKSYKDTKDNTTINVLIQNLQQRFKDTKDDC